MRGRAADRKSDQLGGPHLLIATDLARKIAINLD
jgi:hypothetical protein